MYDFDFSLVWTVFSSRVSFPLMLDLVNTSISTLNKIQKGGVDALKAAKKLLDGGHMSSDVILMVDEMFIS